MGSSNRHSGRLDEPFEAVHEQFARVVAEQPRRVALRLDDTEWTYAEVGARVAALAAGLRERGIGREDRVAVLMRRGADLYATMMAVLQAGAAVLPLDPSYPRARLAHMLSDSGACALIINDTTACGELRDGVLVLDVEEVVVPGASTAPRLDALPEDIAYVLYTSGSTGLPKGVMVTHGGLSNRTSWFRRAFEIGPEDRFLQKTPLGFDPAMGEIFTPLSCGASIVGSSTLDHRDPVSLVEASRVYGATILDLVPAQLEAMLEERGFGKLDALRHILVGGERFEPRLLRAYWHVRSTPIHNLYGPTEATIDCSHWVCDEGRDAVDVAIGRPPDNVRLYVVDRTLSPVQQGADGALLIGGANVARGYLGKPRLTAERFLPDHLGGSLGAVMYDSGDFARWGTDGLLQFRGRQDSQVKIRGNRVELGAVEMLLGSAPGVKSAAVLAKGLADGRADDLMAYIVPTEGVVVDSSALRAHLREHLPESAVPTLFFELPQMPLMPSGKIDRKALQGMGTRVRTADFVAPRTETEKAIAQLWCEQLGIEEIGVEDSFFDVGGQSLQAMRILRLLEQRFDRELALSLLLEHHTVAALAAQLDLAGEFETRPAIEHKTYQSEVTVSSEQRRMWFLQALNLAGVAYNEPVALQLHGALNREALAAALGDLAQRHEVLRTVYPARDGEPVQRILSEPAEVVLRFEDLADESDPELAARELIETSLKVPFRLDEDLPVRALLARLNDTRHILLLTFHHIVVDEWMFRPLLEEFGELFAARSEKRAPALAPVRLQYADYALWQQEQLRGPALPGALQFWSSALENAPQTLSWPMDDESGEQGNRAETVHFQWSGSTTTKLRELARSLEMTDFEALHATFAAFLTRLTGRPDLTLGVPVTMRQRPELQDVVGLLLNTVPARSRFSLDASFVECLQQGREQWRDSAPHHWVPLDEIVRTVGRRRAGESPVLFDTMFTYVPEDAVPAYFGALRQESFEIGGLPEAKGAISLLMAQRAGHFTGALEFDAARFCRASIEAMAGQFERFVSTSLAEPDRAIGDQQLLSADERQVADAWAHGPLSDVSKAPFHEQFETQARATPDRVAVRFEGGEWSYRELDARSNHIANELIRRGVAPEVTVGVCVLRSPELIAALIGVMKAGGVYVALEPSLPVERLHYMVRDGGVKVVVAEPTAFKLLDGVVDEFVSVELSTEPRSESPKVRLAPSHLAYVLYTSGTTGLPKGVMIPHRALSNLVGSYARDIYALEEGSATGNQDRCFAVKASYTFDMFVAEVFPALVVGASLGIAPVDAEREPDRLVRALRDQRVTDLWATPTMVSMLAESGESLAGSSLRTVYCGGEALSASIADFVCTQWGAELWNLYGPTEMCVGQTAHRVADIHSASVVTIGRPTPNHRVAVLDQGGHDVTSGFDGEIAIAGAGEGRGYRNLPRRTALAFVPSVLDGGAGARMYVTGDVGRWKEGGDVAYRGRSDNQLQVRGVRVELGEVEALLERFPGVAKAIVGANNASAGRADSLVAYVVSSAEPAPTASQLREHLARYLAAAVVPAGFVFLDEMPLMASGKVNRRALPAFVGENASSQAHEEPATPTERKLAEIWKELLDCEVVGRNDDFFELGGHSLLAMRLISRIRDSLGAQLKARDVFGHPTLSAMALVIDQHAGDAETDADSLVGEVRRLAPQQRNEFVHRLQEEGRELPLALFPLVRPSQQRASSAQERLWFLAQLDAAAVSAYQIPLPVRMEGLLDVDALSTAVNGVIARHEILRTRLVESPGIPLQVVDEALEIELDVLEVAHLTPQQIESLVHTEVDRPIDLVNGPGLRAILLRWSPTRHVFLIVVHHLLCDGWSADILMREIGVLYDAAKSGADLAEQLPPLDVHYRDFANWQRYWQDSSQLQPQIDYWKQKLVDLQPIALPVDKPRPARASYRGETITKVLPPGLASRVRTLARQERVTLFQALLAAYQALLGRISGQTSFGIGSPVAGRSQKELEPLIGLFINTLVFRADLDGDPNFRELLRRVKSTSLEAVDHQDVPLERLVAELEPVRERGRPPFFQTVFVLNDVGGSWIEGTGKLGDLELAAFPIGLRISKFDLTLTMFDRPEGLVAEFEFALDLFEPETVDAIAQQFEELVEALVEQPDTTLSELSLGSGEQGPPPVSLEQRRLWLLQQTRPNDTAYNVPLVVRLRGPLDTEALQGALTALVARHDILRTVCRPVRSKLNPHDVATLDVLEPPHRVVWDLHDLRTEERNADAIISELVSRPFNLATEVPLRVALVRSGDEEHILALVLHHIAVDEWSSDVLWRDLDALYRAELPGAEPANLPPVSPYHDYPRWRSARSRGVTAVEARAFWKEYLTGAEPDLEWPFASQRPRAEYPAVEHVEFCVGTKVSDAVRAAAERAGVTPEVLLYAGFAAFLARLSGQSDFTIGIPVASRAEAGMQDAVGFFLSTLPVRASVDSATSFEHWIERFARDWARVVEHRWTPFEELTQLASVRAQPGRPSLFDVMFIYVPSQELRSGIGQLEASRVGPRLPHLGVTQAKAALTVGMFDDGEQFAGTFAFDASRFNRDSFEDAAGLFQRLLAGWAANPAARMDRVSLLEEGEQLTLRKWARGAKADFTSTPVHELFEAQVALSPDAVALRFEATQWSYQELNERANQIAHRLRGLGAGPDVPIGVLVERSPELVAAILGVLKAGAAYVPLEPSFPDERLRNIAERAGLRVIVTKGEPPRWVPEVGRVVDVLDESLGSESGENLGVAIDPENLIYVMFTSGSTGVPKGVMVRHESVTNHVGWIQRCYPIGPDDRMLQKSLYGFDMSVTELFAPLAGGAAIVLARPDGQKDPAYLVDVLRREKITVLRVVPTALRLMTHEHGFEDLTSLRWVMLGGEALTADLEASFHRKLPATLLVNPYGITETCVDVTYWDCQPGDAPSSAVPIGLPLDNYIVHIVDDHLCDLPVGLGGELLVGGPGLARGYLGAPMATALKFVPDPFGDRPGARLYTSGDVANWSKDGVLQYRGRKDRQVQVRGNRIELDEIESRLLQHAAVKDAAVVAVGVSQGRADALAGYYVADEPVPFAELRSHMARSLDAAVIPSWFVHLERMPRTSSGKVDRKALPEPNNQLDADAFVAPRDEIESRIAEIWCHHLELEEVGVETDFFEAGGHSLLAVRVVHDLTETFAIDLDLAQFFESPTIAQQAVLVLLQMAADVDLDEFADLLAELGDAFE